jgi:T-complex protein 1 subunit theta
MMKEGSTTVDEPVLKNIGACKELSKITASSMGPYGLCKMVINHLNKLLVTHDASTILSELEVEHPAAKLLVMASKAMQEEIGDGTNFVVALSGELLGNAEGLVRMGLHPSEIVAGYIKSSEKALALLETMSCGKVDDVLVEAQVTPAIRTAISSKQYGYEDFLAGLVAKACINACPGNNPKGFNVDNVRVAKLDGDNIYASRLIHGFVIARSVEGTIKHVKNCKIALYNCAIDVPSTETKGNALLESAEQLLDFSKKEEELMDQLVGAIAAVGVKCVVSTSTYGSLALHMLEKYKIMAVKVPSKFDMMRLSGAVHARVQAKLEAPTPEDCGHCDSIDVLELGGKAIVAFAQEKDDSRISTIVVRGATQNVLDDVERAIEDGINVYKALCKDGRLVAGAGAFEMEMQKQLLNFAEANPGLDQYAARKFAAAFECVPRILAEVSGYNGTNVVALLEAEHNNNKPNVGLNVETGEPQDAAAIGIVDPLAVKSWAIKLATDAVITVLSVDQIIVAKQAGGPKPRGPGARDADDD